MMGATLSPAPSDSDDCVLTQVASKQRNALLESVRISLARVCALREEAFNASGNLADESGGTTTTDDDGSSSSVRSDLVVLGSQLYELLTGMPYTGSTSSQHGPVEAETEETEDLEPSSKRRFSSRTLVDHGVYATLLDNFNLPVSLCILVESLLDANDAGAAGRYDSIGRVEDDLRSMLADPARYLFDPPPDANGGSLHLEHLELCHDRLFGREAEVQEMMAVYDRVIGATTGSDSPGKRELLLLSGDPGTGKSALVCQLRRPLSERGGHIIHGKFEELGQTQPILVIFAAFDGYCRDLLEGDGDADALAETRSAIRDALGPQASALADVLPHLGDVIGLPPSPPDASEMKMEEREQALNRLKFCFRRFLQAIARPTHPVVVFFDDLQWADETTLEFLSSLICHSEVSSMIFAGCYRENEVSEDHPLAKEVDKIASAGVTVSNISVQNITSSSTNTLIADSLHLSPRVTEPLTNLVYSKTSGNPLFVVQFLRSLCDDHLLVYSTSSRRWTWDLEAAQAQVVAENVVDLMKNKMMKFDLSVLHILRIAACLGSNCDEAILGLLSDESADLGPTLKMVMNEGIMYKSGSAYAFSHDQIQEAAYSLIPASERDAFHLEIGRLLWQKSTEDELHEIIFVVMDQLIRGSDLISDRDEAVNVSKLCLMAAEKAMSASAFLPASVYILQGTALLEEEDWESNYELSLRSFSFCAEAQYIVGKYDVVVITCDDIFRHAKCLQDRLVADYTVLSCLGLQGELAETIRYGLDLLELLGETFPREPTEEDVKEQFSATQTLLADTSIEEISQKDELQDEEKYATMKVLSILIRYSFDFNQELLALLIFRAIEISLQYGVCRESPFPFACFGVLLCRYGDTENGRRFGKLALTFLDRFDAKECLARVYSCVYVMINFSSEPNQAVLPQIKYASEVGMETGDIEWALSNSQAYLSISFQAGSNLDELVVEARTIMTELKKYKHRVFQIALPSFQAILNLMGESDDPTTLTGEGMDQDQFLQALLEKQDYLPTSVLYHVRMYLAYLYRRYDIAAEMAISRREIDGSADFNGVTQVNKVFYTGLVAVVMAAQGDDQTDWRHIATQALEEMIKWVSKSEWNFAHKRHLLTAEIAYYLNAEAEGAERAYGDAIRAAKAHRFVNEEALACERAGIFHANRGSDSVAKEHFERARECYMAWGARSKCDDMAAVMLG